MTDDQKQIQENARIFAASYIRPFATRFDEEQGISEDLIKEMARAGYLGATFPEKYGGMAMDCISYGLVTEQFSKACSSARALLTVHTSLVGETILRWGSDKQKNKWLPLIAAGEKIAAFALSEPEVGSDARNIRTAYSRQGTKFLINGKKKWISFAEIADVFLVVAQDNGTVSAFLVDADTPGVTVTPMRGFMANRGTYIAEITFTDLEVSEEQMLLSEGSGFTYIANTALDYGRYSVAWAGLGLAQESLDAMCHYAINRKQFGQRLSSFQSIQDMIADTTINVHSARGMCLNAGTLRREKHEHAYIETIMAKCFTSKIARTATDNAIQVHGANGCHNAYPVERLFREAKIFEIIEGTYQVHQEAISNFGIEQYGKPYRQ
ncbi:acyl-CoA dehydrogenase family protein [Chitinophaga sp. LS1]|uniref:acyl-CoA dehydrogenase family protein n=1 Tax=Chitinophaga sp. LS1 TaxID=3051176 RepID=UPI002AAAA233|nr:acyl-CoA dehydrogenase family protein [Chitinophaga sp. LS1]WPV66526.1 acyl-CoA dehydrogenase family protein [Chitinophaga sp. LS1]